MKHKNKKTHYPHKIATPSRDQPELGIQIGPKVPLLSVKAIEPSLLKKG